MTISLRHTHWLLAAMISLAAEQALAATPGLTLTPWAPNLKVEELAFLSADQRLAVSPRDGLLLLFCTSMVTVVVLSSPSPSRRG